MIKLVVNFKTLHLKEQLIKALTFLVLFKFKLQFNFVKKLGNLFIFLSPFLHRSLVYSLAQLKRGKEVCKMTSLNLIIFVHHL
jgi:hypothetical protein